MRLPQSILPIGWFVTLSIAASSIADVSELIPKRYIFPAIGVFIIIWSLGIYLKRKKGGLPRYRKTRNFFIIGAILSLLLLVLPGCSQVYYEDFYPNFFEPPKIKKAVAGILLNEEIVLPPLETEARETLIALKTTQNLIKESDFFTAKTFLCEALKSLPSVPGSDESKVNDTEDPFDVASETYSDTNQLLYYLYKYFTCQVNLEQGVKIESIEPDLNNIIAKAESEIERAWNALNVKAKNLKAVAYSRAGKSDIFGDAIEAAKKFDFKNLEDGIRINRVGELRKTAQKTNDFEDWKTWENGSKELLKYFEEERLSNYFSSSKPLNTEEEKVDFGLYSYAFCNHLQGILSIYDRLSDDEPGTDNSALYTKGSIMKEINALREKAKKSSVFSSHHSNPKARRWFNMTEFYIDYIITKKEITEEAITSFEEISVDEGLGDYLYEGIWNQVMGLMKLRIGKREEGIDYLARSLNIWDKHKDNVQQLSLTKDLMDAYGSDSECDVLDIEMALRWAGHKLMNKPFSSCEPLIKELREIVEELNAQGIIRLDNLPDLLLIEN